MYLNLKLLEEIHLNSHLHANFACNYSEDDRISILTETGVYVLTLKGYIENVFPRLSFRKDEIKLLNTTINDYLKIDLRPIFLDFCRELFYETITDDIGIGLRSNNVEDKPTQAQWSPRGIIGGTNCALGVLTQFYNLEIYVSTIDENELVRFVCVTNFLKEISNFYRRTWRTFDLFTSHDNVVKEMKSRVDCIIPTTFTWSHLVKSNVNFCVLFVGHRNGSITVWKFKEKSINEASETKLEFLGRHQSQIKCISALFWHRNKNSAGGLCIGDNEGRISALCVSKLKNNVIFSDEVVFCKDTDISVDKITVVNHENYTFFIAIKQNYLFIYAIGENGEVSDGKIVETGSFYVTSLHSYKDNILHILNLSGKMKQIQLSVQNNKVCCLEEWLPDLIDSRKYRTHGFVFSPNLVFIGVLLFPCRARDLGKGKSFINFSIFVNTLRNPFEILMNEPKKNLRDYWDCFEILRVLCIQEKRFPWIGLSPTLNYDSLSLVQLKTLRLISKLSEKVYNLVSYIKEYNIKAYVLLNFAVDIKLAVKQMENLLKIHFNEIVAIDVLTKANLGCNFIEEIYNVMRIANELEYPDMPQCWWCGEKIIGTSCLPFHMDSRCAISLMPVGLNPGYKCPFCQCVVSKEIDKEFFPIFCPYCDIPMEQRYFPKPDLQISPEYRDLTQKALAACPTDIVKSTCFNDCLQEDVSLSYLEENVGNCVVFTDSEEDEDNLKELYDKIKKFVIIKNEERAKSKLTRRNLQSDEEDASEEFAENED